MNVITPVVGTNTIRYADFVRITTDSATYLFSTAPTAITVSAVDANPFTGLSQLVSIGSASRDIKSTANETTVTLVGIDTAMLSLVLGACIKYQYFTGYINSFSISEQWMEEIRGFVGTVTVSASSIQLILQNRTAGRYTNDNAWKQFNPNDTSMNRVNFIQTINYQFGRNAPPNS